VLDADVDDESNRPGTREGHLAELFAAAGLREIESTTLPMRLEHATFEVWWEPFTRGVGPAGQYLSSLDTDRRSSLEAICRRQVLSEPFVVTAVAWAARALA
jgi:hypothetical protein